MPKITILNPLNYDEIVKWAIQYCPSYVHSSVADVSDFSDYYDVIAVFEITDGKDITFFKLRWM